VSAPTVDSSRPGGPARARWQAWHPWPSRSFGETGAVLLAIGAAMGAWASHDLPVGVGAAGVVVALLLRRPWLVVVGVALLTSALGAQAVRGAAPAAPGTMNADVTVMTDPVSERGGTRAEVRDGDGRRFEVHGSGAVGRGLRARLAGERIHVSGAVVPRPDDDTWLLRRHVIGTVRARSVDLLDDGNVAALAANSFRRTLVRGAASLPVDEQALYSGFVFGDDRNERPEVIEDFRASGLSHLLAVSGENVAFVLVAAQPLLSRLGVRSRFAVAVAMLAFFAFATRLEPSVLRATAMAMVAVLATTLGRPVSALRTLALAVTVLLVLDPFLVGVLGFQLSVAASAGIIVLSRPLAARLPGPRVLANVLAVTLAAQVGVAPLLLTTFGTVPLVALPANVAAVPAAGPVMVWGLTGGVVAGLLGGPVAAAIHLPTHALLWWVATVARVAASLPFGDLDARQSVVVAGGALAFTALLRSARAAHVLGGSRPTVLGTIGVTALSAVVVWTHPVPAGAEVALTRGAQLHNGANGGAVLVVDGSMKVGEVLAGLRRNGVRRLDVLVARSRGSTIDAAISTLVDRVPTRLVLVPSGGAVDGDPSQAANGARVAPARGELIVTGDLVVAVEQASPRLQVRVGPASADETGAPTDGVGSARGPP